MEAKLTNNQLTYYTEGSTIMIGDRLVTNPTAEQRKAEGYKEVIYQSGNGGTYETAEYIIIETPLQEVVELSNEEMREQAYATEPVIMWEGKLRTCDFIRGLIVTYGFLGSDKVEELKELWLEGRVVIKTIWSDDEQQPFEEII